MKFKCILTTLIFTLMATYGVADEIHLKNGDKLSGTITMDSPYRLVVETKAMGEVIIDKDFVQEYKTEQQLMDEAKTVAKAKKVEVKKKMKKEQPKATSESDIEWVKKATLAYTQKAGNDTEQIASAEIFVNRKTADDEATIKTSAYIETEDSKTDSRKFYGLLRYANSFGEEKKWFQFGKLEGNKDKTANVNYRITPSYGVGYWITDQKDFKFRVEGAFGLEYTKYDDGSASETEAIFSPSAHLEKHFDNGISFVQDLTLYPSLEEGDFRLRSESAITGKMTEQLSWKFSLIDDYDSDPTGGKKKNDVLLISGLEYAF